MENLIKKHERFLSVIILLGYFIWVYQVKPDPSKGYDLTRKYYTTLSFVMFLITSLFLLIRESLLTFRINNLPVEAVTSKNALLIVMSSIALIASNIMYFLMVIDKIEMYAIVIFIPILPLILSALHSNKIFEGEEYFIYSDTKYYYDDITQLNVKNPTKIKMVINGKNKNITTYSSKKYIIMENILKEHVKHHIDDIYEA